MRSPAVAVLLLLASAASAEAQVQRNPTGTTTLGGPTRGPTGASATPAPSPSRTAEPSPAASPDRPPLGSAGAPQGNLDRTSPGHTLGVGPNSPGSTGTGLSGGAAGVANPAGANGGALPQGTANIRSNGASTGNGSKGAPMQANGVRKVQ